MRHILVLIFALFFAFPAHASCEEVYINALANLTVDKTKTENYSHVENFLYSVADQVKRNTTNLNDAATLIVDFYATMNLNVSHDEAVTVINEMLQSNSSTSSSTTQLNVLRSSPNVQMADAFNQCKHASNMDWREGPNDVHGVYIPKTGTNETFNALTWDHHFLSCKFEQPTATIPVNGTPMANKTWGFDCSRLSSSMGTSYLPPTRITFGTSASSDDYLFPAYNPLNPASKNADPLCSAPPVTEAVMDLMYAETLYLRIRAGITLDPSADPNKVLNVATANLTRMNVDVSSLKALDGRTIADLPTYAQSNPEQAAYDTGEIVERLANQVTARCAVAHGTPQ